MTKKRVPLYERLPEIYRIKDSEQHPPEQLKNFISLVEEIFGAIHENIESLYHDLFIETCDDWVIPYIGDLLGTTHLKGEPWTLRADVADTIALRRRKGTLGAIELLTYNLTQWGAHALELRNNLVWAQHLNHQRPDADGKPPYSLPNVDRNTPIRGGTIILRDPAMLALLNTPFNPFAYIPDLKKPESKAVVYNLPNLAIFLWRLEAYSISVSKPKDKGFYTYKDPADNVTDIYGVRFYIHPLAEPIIIFNTHRFDLDKSPPKLTRVDEVPGPIHPARITSGSQAGNPESYIAIETYDENGFDPIAGNFPSLDVKAVGLQLHVPQSQFNENLAWTFRGANLCAWENGLQKPLAKFEVAVDPIQGRMLVSVATQAQRDELLKSLLITYTYGAVGKVGAQPISRGPAPVTLHGENTIIKKVNFHADKLGLKKALKDLNVQPLPMVIEILDSMPHVLDLTGLSGTVIEDGGENLQLNKSLIIRAKAEERPVIKLKQPLRFKPANVNADLDNLTVKLEGLYITRDEGFPSGQPLIARAALHQMELSNCTLDPGGYQLPNKTRAAIHKSMQLKNKYGFSGTTAFDQTPEIIIQRCITGPLLIDNEYKLFLKDSIIDAGYGVGQSLSNSSADFAVSGATDQLNTWGPPTKIDGITVFGCMRVEELSGSGGIWVHKLEVWNNQKGCIKFSYFSGQGDRLPQNHACVLGTNVTLRFTSEYFGNPAYGQLSLTSDYFIREQGPNEDAMGAFGFLLETHKWRNLKIRFREFMPIGIRPLLIPVT